MMAEGLPLRSQPSGSPAAGANPVRRSKSSSFSAALTPRAWSCERQAGRPLRNWKASGGALVVALPGMSELVRTGCKRPGVPGEPDGGFSRMRLRSIRRSGLL